MEPTRLHIAEAWMQEYRGVLREAGEHWARTGEWLSMSRLGRSALKRDVDTDVFGALHELPQPVGQVEHFIDHVVLRVRGLVITPQARPFLEGYVRALGLATLRLKSDEEYPVLREEDLTEVLGMSEPLASRVSQLLVNEDWMFHGGNGEVTKGWERGIGEYTRDVIGVATVEDYLRVEGQRLWSRPANQAAGTSYNALVATGVIQPDQGEVLTASLAADEFQPFIAGQVQRLLANEHYDEAVQRASIAFCDVLREVSGLHDLDGDQLMGAAFGGPAPAVEVANLTTDRGKREQEGWRMLAQGCIAALRNPGAHRISGYDRLSAMEAIATMSLVARRATQVGPESDSDRDPVVLPDASSAVADAAPSPE